jgi:hypothetical protein
VLQGFVLDDARYDTDVPAAVREFHRYQFNFGVSNSLGKGMSRQGKRPRVTNFLVDASCCLEGNPLAQTLDYRAFKDGWQVDGDSSSGESSSRDGSSGDSSSDEDGVEEDSSSKANAMLLPFSDNDTGRVYVAVLTLRDVTVAAGEDMCIDYGDENYWNVKRDHAEYLQLAKQQYSREQHRELKQQLKQQADKLIQHGNAEIALKNQLQQLLAASSATGLRLKGQPTVDGLADAVCAATMVVGNHQEAVAAAVAAVVGAQVQDELNSAADRLAHASKRHAETVQGLQQQLEERDAAASYLAQQLQQLHQQIKRKDASVLSAQQAAAKHAEANRVCAATVQGLQQQMQGKDAAALSLQREQKALQLLHLLLNNSR